CRKGDEIQTKGTVSGHSGCSRHVAGGTAQDGAAGELAAQSIRDCTNSSSSLRNSAVSSGPRMDGTWLAFSSAAAYSGSAFISSSTVLKASTACGSISPGP